MLSARKAGEILSDPLAKTELFKDPIAMLFKEMTQALFEGRQEVTRVLPGLGTTGVYMALVKGDFPVKMPSKQ